MFNIKEANRHGVTPSHLLTVKEAADSMKLGRSTFLDLVYSGAIPSVKIGRRRLINPLALDAYIQGLEEGRSYDSNFAS
jgi:excisionase family DNA binding protein